MTLLIAHLVTTLASKRKVAEPCLAPNMVACRVAVSLSQAVYQS